MKRLVILTIFLLAAPAAYSSEQLLQKKPGFVGYVPAGSVIQVQQVDLHSEILTVLAENDREAGKLKVSFKNFERALGGKKKVVFLNKVEPLKGRTFTLKHNLVLTEVKN